MFFSFYSSLRHTHTRARKHHLQEKLYDDNREQIFGQLEIIYDIINEHQLQTLDTCQLTTASAGPTKATTTTTPNFNKHDCLALNSCHSFSYNNTESSDSNSNSSNNNEWKLRPENLFKSSMFPRASKNPLTQLLVQKSGSYELKWAEDSPNNNKRSASSIELSGIVAGYDVGQLRPFQPLPNANVSSYLKSKRTTTTTASTNISGSSSNGSTRSNSQSAKQQIAKLIQQTSSKLLRAQSSISLSSNCYYLNNSYNNNNNNDNNNNNYSNDDTNRSQPSFKLQQQPQEQLKQISCTYNDKDSKNNNNNHDFSISNHNYHNNHMQDGVTLCTLGVGTTFGASVIPGKSHSVSVVTSDDCTLLRVRRADFQEIFNEQSHLINNVESSPFCSFTSLNRFTASNAVSKRGSALNSADRSSASNGTTSLESTPITKNHTTTASRQALVIDPQNMKQQHQQDDPLSQDDDDDEDPDQQTQQQQDGDLADFNLDSIDSNELSSHLMRIGWVLRTLMLDQCPHLIQNRRIYPHQLHKQHAHHSHKSSATRLSSSTTSSSITSAAAAAAAEKNPGKQKHLVSMASSSQLLTGSSASNTATSTSSSTKSAASAAGRKVANYVASSFMRANSKATAAAAAAVALAASNNQQQQTSTNSKAPIGSHALFISSSFDATSGPQTNVQANNLHHLTSSNHATMEKTATMEMTTAATKEEPVLFRRSMLGREMVDWLVNLSQAAHTNASRFVTSRLQAISMWQVLLEQGIVFSYTSQVNTVNATTSAPFDKLTSAGNSSGLTSASSKDSLQQRQHCCQFQFCDDQHAYYKFWFDRDGTKQQPCDELIVGSDTTTTTTTTYETNSQDLLPKPSESDLAMANESLWWSLKVLSKIAPDACFRLILSKQPHERSSEEVDIVYEELQHLKALSHLTNSVKKELAACVTSEYHAKQNTVIFNQGDVGQSWYIILRGSVNVVIVGKGVVCTLHDGDDFGKLALVNDAPRAATIVTNESNCYFLRVDKHNFNTILRDVEANTVRLKEHGKEVLILQKVAVKEQTGEGQQSQVGSSQTDASTLADQLSSVSSQVNVSSGVIASSQPPFSGIGQQFSGGSSHGSSSQSVAHQQQQQQQVVSSALKYMVMAGTSDKMLEHLLETRIDGQTQIGPLHTGRNGLYQHDQVSSIIQCHGDNFLEDFILTHKIFMPTANLCQELLKQYQCQTKSQLSQASGQQQQPQNGKNQRNSSSSNNNNNSDYSASGSHTSLDDEYLVAKKRRVVKFIRCWMLITREHFFQQQQIQSFLTTIHQKVKQDATRFSSLQPELKAIAKILELHLEEELDNRHKGVQHWIEDVYGNILPIRRHYGAWELNQSASVHQSELFLASLHQRRFEHKLSTILSSDEVVFRVYCTDHSYATLKTRADEKAVEIKQLAAYKLNLRDKELILVHVKSNGERIIYNDLEFNISTSLSVNGRIFVCPLDHIDAISPLPEQDPFQEVYQSLNWSAVSTNTTTDSSLANNSSSSNNNLNVNNVNSMSTNSTTPAALNNSNNNNNNNNSADSNHDKQTNNSTNQQTSTASGLSSSGTGTGTSQQQPQQQQLINQQQQQNNNSMADTNSGASGSGLSSHLLTTTPTNYADIRTQMGLSVSKLEEFSSRDVAYCLTQLAWSLLKNMHEFELIYTVFGRHNFKQITANLNVFLRHFNEIQYWVVTQICLSSSLSKRVQILRKFIKIAAHCKELKNLNAFFAIIMGLSNMAVARLTQTWERLPNKLKRTFSQFESLIDPSRNHRRYRIFMSKMEPPIIPFMPLFLKDMTFAHEGNKTYLENGLINFEKMQMVAQTLRTIRYCKSRPMKLDSSVCKFKGSIRTIELFFRDLKIIDNQRTLTQMSHQLEHRKT